MICAQPVRTAASAPARASSSRASDPPVGTCALISRHAAIVAPKLATSTPYATESPNSAMSTPPTAGPAIMHVCHIAWLSTNADGSCSAVTRFGVIDERTESANPPNPAPSAAPAYTSASGGWPISALASSTPDPAA